MINPKPPSVSQLRAVFGNQDPAARFVPRSTGGTTWRVYDKRLDRFLSDREVAQIADPLERLLT